MISRVMCLGWPVQISKDLNKKMRSWRKKKKNGFSFGFIFCALLILNSNPRSLIGHLSRRGQGKK